MAARVAEYRRALIALPPDAVEAYLLERSGLPGPRANLELAAAAVDVLPVDRLRRFAALGPEETPKGTAREYLPLVGVSGLGRVLVDADRAGNVVERRATLDELRHCATDSRWRVREAVAIALQRWGAADLPALLREMPAWAADSDLLVQRATVAAICEPALLRATADTNAVLGLLGTITANVARSTDRRSDAFRVLRQALAYGWSVAVAASPATGEEAMDTWLASDDPDVRWLMRENLRKSRLHRMDPDWTAARLARL